MTAAPIGASLASSLLQSSLLRSKVNTTSHGESADDIDQAQEAAAKITGETGTSTTLDPDDNPTTPANPLFNHQASEREDLPPATQQATDSAELVGYPSYNSFGRYKAPRPSAGTALNVAA